MKKHHGQCVLIEYWRNSLADNDRLGFRIDSKQLQSATRVPTPVIEGGELPKEEIEIMFAQEEEEKYKFEKKIFEIEFLDVFIVPFIYQKKTKHTYQINSHWAEKYNRLYPLIIPAKVNRKGQLSQKKQFELPWIARDYLTPTLRKELVLGDIQVVDEFYSKNELLHDDTVVGWADFYEYANQLLKHVAGKMLGFLEQNNKYQLLQEGLFIQQKSMSEPSKQIKKYLDSVLVEAKKPAPTWKMPPLLKNYLNLDEIERKALLTESEKIEYTRRHLGHISETRYLAESQREALLHFFAQKQGDILAINGPPGTGKTTLLQSVVISLWVEAAVKNQSPPIVVAASGSNQAVKNVLQGFILPLNSKSILRQRWLPDPKQNKQDVKKNGFDIASLSLYLVSKYKKDEIERIPYLCNTHKGFEGNADLLRSEDYFATAKEYFIDKAKSYFSMQELTLATIKKLLKVKLQEYYTRLNGISDLLAAKHDIHETLHHYGGLDNLNNQMMISNQKILDFKQEITALKQKFNQWDTLQDDLFWTKIFMCLPIIKHVFKQKYRARIHSFLRENDFLEMIQEVVEVEKISDYLHRLLLNVQGKIKSHEAELSKIETILESIKTKINSFNKNNYDDLGIIVELNDEIKISSTIAGKSVQDILDTTLRYHLFLYALHFWEASWLIEMNAYQEKNTKYTNHNFADADLSWRQWAMVSPCFVSTLYMGSVFFQYKDKSNKDCYLENYIDLLIVDEAGQSSSSVGAAMFGLAKQALVVGDIMQIQPILNIPREVDCANAIKANLIKDRETYYQFNYAEKGIWNANVSFKDFKANSIMRIAQRRCPYTVTGINGDTDVLRGFLLKEHWRCVPSIIGYCNELVYHGELIPKRREHSNPIFPSMGYAHIKGHCANRGGSKVNEIEAETLVSWLKENQERIEKHYNSSPLEDLVGIVTPFAAQTQVLKKFLRSYKIRLDKVGTIHTLQGAEKPIIIFSPVYTRSTAEGTNLFFDLDRTMLNVAVSRAKDSFLVFGDMDIFDPNKLRTPSGLLARYLFSSPNNEITDLKCIQDRKLDSSMVALLNTRELHKEAIENAFRQAKKSIYIVSPFISIHAIRRLGMENILKLKANNVTVFVYIDAFLNGCRNRDTLTYKGKDAFTANTKLGIDYLLSLGVEIVVLHNIHSKIICVDETVLISGSYNWLSAATSDTGMYARYESSLKYTGLNVSQFIQQTLLDLKKYIVYEFKAINNSSVILDA